VTLNRNTSAALLALAALLTVSACGKSIVISDSAPAAQTSAAPTPAAPAPSSAPPSSPAAGSNSGLQLVNGSAADNGVSGDGGTPAGGKPLPEPAKWVQLSTVTTDAIGTYVADINKATLYRFDSDSKGESTCYDACAAAWPPVLIKEHGRVFVFEGIDPADVGFIRRKDGTIQLTVGHWPIYRFSGDTQLGDTNGQGKDGVWFAIGPKGDKAAHS
jgi:predicted lipoprotein with Yx(FWY)xxD motif